MNFQRGKRHEELEINFIPLIDVLLVMLIFLAATTTFNREMTLKITLPSAQAESASGTPIEVVINQEGQVAVGQRTFSSSDQVSLEQVLKTLSADSDDPVVVILADAMASHQSVIDAMQAARRVGIGKIHFATKASD